MRNSAFILIVFFSSIYYINAQSGPFIYDGYSYHLTPEGLSWTDAQVYSESQGSNLVTIEDLEEYNFILDSIINPINPYLFYYIGLSAPMGSNGEDENNYTWVDGSTSSYRNWRTGDPNIMDERYVGIHAILGGWLNVENENDFFTNIGIYKIEIPPVPTFSEWGLIILFLLFICLGTVALFNKKYKSSYLGKPLHRITK